MSVKTKGLICALIGGICWGFSGCCGQYLFDYKAMDSAWLTTARMLIAGAMLTLYSLLAKREKLLAALRDGKALRTILYFGILGLMLCQYSYLTSIKYTNAPTATVIQYAGPVLVMLVTCLMQKRLPQLAEFFALSLAVGGTFLVATHGDPSTLVISEQGLFWCIISALTVVGYTLIPIKVVAKYSSQVVNGIGMLMGGALLLLITRAWQIRINLDFGTISGMAGIIIIGTILAFTLYMKAVADIGPVKASIVASIEPVSSAVISWLWLGNSFAPADLLGFALIISTVFLLRGKKPKAEYAKLSE